jgi:hypothetical protein
VEEQVDRWLNTTEIAKMLGFPSRNALMVRVCKARNSDKYKERFTLELTRRDGRLGQRLSVVQQYLRGE